MIESAQTTARREERGQRRHGKKGEQAPRSINDHHPAPRHAIEFAQYTHVVIAAEVMQREHHERGVVGRVGDFGHVASVEDACRSRNAMMCEPSLHRLDEIAVEVAAGQLDLDPSSPGATVQVGQEPAASRSDFEDPDRSIRDDLFLCHAQQSVSDGDVATRCALHALDRVNDELLGTRERDVRTDRSEPLERLDVPVEDLCQSSSTLRQDRHELRLAHCLPLLTLLG